MFPFPAPVPTRPCRACRSPVRVDRAVQGYGADCAAKRGLITSTPRLRVELQSGPSLFDAADEDDMCDGWDR